jgi:uncharacterized protein YjbI with pentapeptide repeats
MGNTTNKDELLKLLRSGLVEKFNDNRSYDEELLNLTELDFKDSDVHGANFCKVDLSGSDLSETELNQVDFSGSDLSSVNFSNATIIDCSFLDTILEGSIFNRASLINCDFTSAEFNGANICGADLTGSDLSLCENLMHTAYNKNTVWPSDECLPDDFDPEYDQSFSELEDEPEFTEDQYSY